MSGSTTIPVVLSAAGRIPQSPAALLAQYQALALTYAPGLTATLPGSLVEDMSSTALAAVVQMDQAVTEVINSITPYGANAFLLLQLGNQAGIQQGVNNNATVPVIFTGPAGYVINVGFTVSDGTYQYVIEDGGVIATSGTSQPLTALCTTVGTFPIPANTVNQIVTSLPGSIVVTCNNPLAGVPGAGVQPIEQYRSQVLIAGQATAQGTPDFVKTQLLKIPGVLPNLVSIAAVVGGWEIICGGGDEALVAGAIYLSIGNIADLQPSYLYVQSITQANPGVVTTLNNHGFVTGQTGITFVGLGGMTALNSGSYTVTVINEKSFSIGVNTSSYTAYTSGGYVLPNARNVSVPITSYPNIYNIPFVIPPQQIVNVGFTWNTNLTGYIASGVIDGLGQTAIINYINSLVVGQPINVFQMQAAFQTAVAPNLPIQNIIRMVVSVSINGVSSPPISGTGEILGDTESYFYASLATVVVAQG